MNRNLISLAGLVLMAAAGTSANAETKFIANSFYDGGHPLSKFGYVEWADIVKDLSGGDLAPEVYTGTVLLAPRAALQGAQDNVVQVANISAVYIPSEMPVANAVQELGFNYSDPKAMIFAATDFSMHNPTQLKEWTDNKIVYLGAYTTPPYILFCTSPVTTLAEFKGKRIRTAGSAVSMWVEEAGGVPVNVPSSEMYTGLERGSLDCATNAANDLIDRSLWEVAKHTTLLPTGMYWAGPEWGYNTDFWTGLSVEQRSVLMEATARSMARMIINYAQRAEDALTEAQEKGNTVAEPGEDLFGFLAQRNARCGDRQLPWRPEEQHGSEFIFQRLDLAAQRRLRHVQGICRARETELVGHGKKITKLPDLHDDYPQAEKRTLFRA